MGGGQDNQDWELERTPEEKKRERENAARYRLAEKKIMPLIKRVKLIIAMAEKCKAVAGAKEDALRAIDTIAK